MKMDDVSYRALIEAYQKACNALHVVRQFTETEDEKREMRVCSGFLDSVFGRMELRYIDGED